MDLTKQSAATTPDLDERGWQAGRVANILEVEIRGRRTDRAEALLPEYAASPYRNDASRRKVRTLHLRGGGGDARRATRYRGGDNWDDGEKIAKIERTQARLLARGR